MEIESSESESRDEEVSLEVENNLKTVVQSDSTEKINESDSIEKINKSDSTEKINESDSTEKINKSDAIEKIKESDSTEKINESDSKEKINESDSTEKINKSDSIEKIKESDSTDKINESIDNDGEAKEDESCEKPQKDSFKKPALLIGPRRGKPGQLRSVSGANFDGPKPLEPLQPQPQLETESDENKVKSSESEKSRAPASDKLQIPLPYKEPSWGGEPTAEYKMEVLKSGVILQTIDMGDRSFHVIGRLPTCDVSLAHPTISRYHAVLQYRVVDDEKHSKGFYLYDLGSTHGTFWNGCRIRPNTYVKLCGGHMIRFGCSQRKFILQTPPEDIEEESELTVTELKEKRRLELLERERAEIERKQQEEEAERLRIEREAEEGISWGMAEDADEESDLTENPYALTNNEELFLDDPKKTLRGWFEREGHDLQYQTEEKGIGQFLCWVDLPLDTSTGRSVRAEALVKGKKKESVIQCALEACRILDRHGVLRQATHEARKRKTRNWEEEDFYDSDEDNFLDRTGAVEKKREQRMRHAGKLEETVETYASLLEKHTTVTNKIVKIESELRKSQKMKEAAMAETNEDALDAYMSSLNSTVLNKADVMKMKLELQGLRKEEERLLKLVNITRPANLPSLTCQKPSNDVPRPEKSGKKNLSLAKKRSIDRDSNSAPIKKSAVDETVSKAQTEESDNSVQQSQVNEPETADSKPAEPYVEDHPKSLEAVTTQESTSIENESSRVETARSTSADDTQKTDNDIVKKKKRNIRRMQQRAEKAAKETQKGYEDAAYDEDYSMWLPPQDQSGDGKTDLNKKYGY